MRNYAEQGLWLLGAALSDADIDQRMARGTEAMQGGRYAEAISVFTDVIEKPGFAEGWNRRATVHYLAGEFDKSIADCHEVLSAIRVTSARFRAWARFTSSSSNGTKRSVVPPRPR